MSLGRTAAELSRIPKTADETPVSSAVFGDHSSGIRLASWRDFPSVWRLEKLCFGRDAWSGPDVFSALLWPGVVRLKAESEGTLVGFVAADGRPGERSAWITTIGVHPDYRRQGIAGQLLRACESRLKSERVRLTVRANNLAAIRLYRKLGYEQIETWQQYYVNGEDGVVMEKWIQGF